MTGTPRHTICIRTFFLIAILALQGIGWFVAWQVARWDAKSAAKTALKNSDTPIFKITITVTQLCALRVDDREIRWQGQLCDIQSAVYQGDSVTLSLYYDHYEAAILDRLFCFFELQDADSQLYVRKTLAKWLGAIFLVISPPVLSSTCAVLTHQPNFSPHRLIAQYVPGCYYPPPE